MGGSTIKELPGLEAKQWDAIITNANTDTQIAIVSWSPPANAFGILKKLIISNQNAGAALITAWDADITSTSSTKPPARGSTAAPKIPPINLAANAQLYLDEHTCPNMHMIGGLTMRSSVNSIYVNVEWYEQLG